MKMVYFFAQNSIAHHFESPLPLIFNSTFQFYFPWKFYSDLIQIFDFTFFRVKQFESPRGADFQLEN